MIKYQVFYFKTNWCEICKKITLYFKAIANHKKLKPEFEFLMATLDNRKDLVERFKIKEYPTFIIFEDNKEIYRQENGNLGDLVNKLNELLGKGK